MAEDGMILNFASEVKDTDLQRPKFKGGSWKDRFLVQRAAKYHARKRAAESFEEISGSRSESASESVQARGPQRIDEFPTDRPLKRARQNGDFQPSAGRVAELSNQDRQGQKRPQKSAKSREVISSLFSYNPRSTAANVEPADVVDSTPAIPSNAPLVDGIDTFTSLGLSPTLAAHLLQKMDLKNPTGIQRSAVSQLLKEDSDAFIQSQTGSGKTLAYLLPLVERIMRLSEQEKPIDRATGLLAVVLAPTRELCKQIAVVLERLLGCAHWIVAGTVIGGEKKKSEKARLRKGLNILIATPGRLLDHLSNTKVLDISNVRWLILDEGDRLMDLGFEEDISKIVRTLEERQKHANIPGLPEKRTTVLCSATIKMNVQKLGDISLKDAVLIRGESDDNLVEDGEQTDSVFLAPAQLKQSYVVVAAKLRLVTLTALLRRTFARKGSVMKAIVFVSCADSVDFHFEAFTREAAATTEESEAPSFEESQPPTTKADHDSVRPAALISASSNPLILYKLHGSLPQATRTSIVKAFASATTPSLLLATDVASRGLDLPNLDLVIEYDPPFSSEDHLHRIGRTARVGRDGRAVIFLLPGSEEGYVEVLRKSYKSSSEGGRTVTQTVATDLLKKGFGQATGIVTANDWEAKATEFQLDVERWVLANAKVAEMAKKAFQSHIRAYATHVAKERMWFDIKELHLGHLAKAFGLRDAPGRMNVQGLRKGGSSGAKKDRRAGERRAEHGERAVNNEAGVDEEAAKKMRDKVRNRKMMMGAGADEFNIA